MTTSSPRFWRSRTRRTPPTWYPAQPHNHLPTRPPWPRTVQRVSRGAASDMHVVT